MLFQYRLKTLAVDFARRSSGRDRRKTRSVSGQNALTQQDFVGTPLVETLETRKLLSVDPVMVADLVVGANGSNPNFVNVNGTLFFRANDDVSGYELWRSDGTSAGTTLVKDIVSGFSGSYPTSLTNVDGTLFFTANDGTNGYELWRSDGTSAGTTLVKDICNGLNSSGPNFPANVNGTLFFTANDGVNGIELWQSDGTSAGTKLVKDILNGAGSSNLNSLTNVNGTLFFRATDGVNGVELWQSDGTSAGTTLVKDISSGPNSSGPSFLTNVNGTLFFQANDGVNGDELWQSDGTSAGTTLLEDIVSGAGSSSPGYLTNVNGTLFFRANDGVNGIELWQSDGTSSGTILVKDMFSGFNGSLPRFLTNVNGTLFFTANVGAGGQVLCQSDGTPAGTRSGSFGSNLRYLTNVNGTLFFRTIEGGGSAKLWKADVPADTPKVTTQARRFLPPALVKDISSGSNGSSPFFPTNVNGTFFFSADDGVNGSELWQSDGTSAGTTLTNNIRSSSGPSFPVSLANVNGTLFFSADDGVNGFELWQSDGTSAGTTLVKDIRIGGSGSSPQSLTNINGTLFFSANDGVNGYELWQSDGTPAGTTLVKDIVSGGNSIPRSLTNVNGTLFFSATDGVNGYELWQSDGTSAGTKLVKDISSGSSFGSSFPRYLTNVNGTLFFSANDGVKGYELWQSDGTSAGTTLVKDIVSGGNSFPRYLTNVNGTLYFRATDGLNGYELWQSDGTSAGTTLVKDIVSGGNSSPRYLTNVDGTLFFSANDGVNGDELWRSDGTSAGTTIVKDISSGSSNSNPRFLTNVNGTLFFSANDGVNGHELWLMPVNSRPQLTAFAAAVDTTPEDTEVELTLAELATQGNESDGDGTVNAFIVQAITSGTLKIGTSAATATAFAVGSNDRIDAIRNAYWTPAANIGGNAIAAFTVLAQDNVGDNSNLPVTATVNVTAVADTPSVTNTSTSEDVQSTSGLVISRDAADGAEVTHFRITGITGGLLFQNDGITAIANNEFITFAQGNAGLKFTPSLNSNATGHFAVQASTSNVDGGLGGSKVTSDIAINPVADTPSVTNAATYEDLQSTNGLVISRNAADGAEVTYFKITNISGGSLFHNDGITAIANNEFITFAQANAGLKFTPSLNSNATGHFTVQASTSNADGGLGGATVTADIAITPVADTPSVTDASTNEDVKSTSGLVISRNAADGAEVTHFRITNITGGSLFQNDGTTAISNNTFITFAEANAGLKFTPSLNSNAIGHFTVQASTSNVDGGLGGSTVTADITINPVADTPSVSNTSTLANTQTTSGLVISRNAADGAEVTHFKITSITGGKLFLNNGTTPIRNGAFITAAQASAGLRFTPSQNSRVTGHFSARASKSNSDAGLGGGTVVANISITAAPIGTAGNDVFVLTYSGAALTGTVSVSISTNGGPATAFGTYPMNTALTVNGLGGTDSVRIVGTAGADTITVNSSTGLVVNGARLTLTSIETRTLTGAAGSDIYKFDSDSALGLFTLNEAAGGTDTIDLSLTTTVDMSLNLGSAASQLVHANLRLILGSGSVIENAIGGSGNDTLSGNSVANVLTGNAGNDRLTGGAGNDSLIGGFGNDTYVFGIALVGEADTVTEATSAGTDTLSFSTLTTAVVLNLGTTAVQTVHSKRTLKLNSAATIENAVGGAGNDTLSGNSLPNSLTGNAGNDILLGNAGNDTLSGGNGRDILIGGHGMDALLGGNDDDILIAGRTTSDTLFTKLGDLRTEWVSARSYATRTTHLRTGVGASVALLKAKVTVFNEPGAVDTLTGGSGTDWYFRALDDVIRDLLAAESVDVL